MYGAVCGAIVGACATDELHDVDFSTRWPADCSNVVSEHPDGRPDTLAVWKRSAYIDATKFPRFDALGFDAARGVVRCIEVLVFRSNG